MRLSALALSFVLGASLPAVPSTRPAGSLAPIQQKLARDLGAGLSAPDQARLQRGMAQAAALWTAKDGSPATFEAFVKQHFARDAQALDALYHRLAFVLESLDGHLLELGRDLRWHTDLDLGPLLPADELLSGWNPGAHVNDDLFANKLAFVVLLNFRQSTLAERLKEGETWTRRDWAEARLVDRFTTRIPAEAAQAVSEAAGEADRYIASYNIWAHHLLDAKGQRPFPAGKRLLSHWNLRDELKSQYAQEGGLERQRMLAKVMERIVTQEIPASVIDNPRADWNPFTNQVAASAVKDHELPAVPGVLSAAPEGLRRYEILLKTFQAVRKLDRYTPHAPTHIARSFEEGRQLPEARVRKMLEDVVGSPLVKEVAALASQRLGRPLEPFDLWYSGFKPRPAHSEAELDALTRKRFPTAAAYKAEMPTMLRDLGFAPETADFLASKIEVDPARGSGHAMGAERRSDSAHLRTRVGQGGMDYKGFNIAVHEMGHNVEQVFSLNRMDHFFLKGVPNTAFTEAMAFVFQARDLELLGLPKAAASERAWGTLHDFWSTYEIAGVGLVDMQVWRWMYDHPQATPVQLKQAVLSIAKEVWNRYYAPVLGQKDSVLLAIYSHMIHSFLYLPDYAIGHMIAHQVEEHLEGKGKLGAEVERMTRLGRLTPDLWMQQATGRPVGPEAMLEAAAKALKAVRTR